MRRHLGIAWLLILLTAVPLWAQGPLDWGKDKILITGSTFVGTRAPVGDDVDVFGFEPILLIRLANRLLFEAEPELEVALIREGGANREAELERSIEYAQLDIMVHNSLMLVVGRWVTPFGVFNEKLHPAWINKLPTAPIIYGHEGLLPGSQVGLQLRGGFLAGNGAKLNYITFLSTGPLLDTEGEMGFKNSWTDHSKRPAFGGRLGLSPRSRFELGGSFFRGAYDTDGKFHFTYAGADAEYRAEMVEVRGEYLRRTQQSAEGNLILNGLYAQGALKLSFIPVMFFNPTELVVRYSRISGAEPGASSQIAVGFNYALTSRSFIRLALTSDKAPEESDEAMGADPMPASSKRTNYVYITIAHGL